MAFMTTSVSQNYEAARERFAAVGVDTDAALQQLAGISISMHCWQGDDVGGFESSKGTSGGGILATGNYPGKATNLDELRKDLEQAYSLIPGSHRLNLHAMYLDNGGKSVDRDEVDSSHFSSWKDWAKAQKIGVDFNPSFFAHPMADSGFTLASNDSKVRDYWIEHGRRCREIGAFFGRELGKPCVTNVWIPDGFKDTPVDRLAPRRRLAKSLDAIFEKEIDPQHNLDAVECKLFGIGSESYVVGSHEFYLSYAIKNQKVLCLDSGHFHPTETIADKVSSVIDSVPGILLHVSRGVRWDSDHVVTLNDELTAIGEELVRSGSLDRIHIGLDFFDASINRIAAWTIGTRNTLKSLLRAFLQPTDTLREFEAKGDFTSRLAMQEELKTLPWGAVWEYHCEKQGVPGSLEYLKNIRSYEESVLSKRPV